jgi:hypothetical protein
LIIISKAFKLSCCGSFALGFFSFIQIAFGQWPYTFIDTNIEFISKVAMTLMSDYMTSKKRLGLPIYILKK